MFTFYEFYLRNTLSSTYVASKDWMLTV